MTITLGGLGEASVLIAYIIQSFQKFFVSPLVKFPPPIRTATSNNLLKPAFTRQPRRQFQTSPTPGDPSQDPG